MTHVQAAPNPGDVKVCSECGRTTAVYALVPNSLFVSAAEAAHPGRLPDTYAWTCSECGHEERDMPVLVHNEPHTGTFL